MEISNIARIWKADKEETIDRFLHHLQKGKDKLVGSLLNIRVKGFGRKLDGDVKITELDMEDGDYFIAEIKESNKRWFLTSDN